MRYEISSAQNKTFKIFEELLTSSGINAHNQALIFGEKAVTEVLRDFSGKCLGLLTTEEFGLLPLIETKNHYFLSKECFSKIDIFGTRFPILLVTVSDFNSVKVEKKGCHLVIPFQEPSNVGATLRSAAAFGVSQIFLLQGVAHPFHPKSARASSGALFLNRYQKVSSLYDVAKAGLPTVALDLDGESLNKFSFPQDFILIPGVEGQGLPKEFNFDYRVKIPIDSKVDSLNGPVSVAVALYHWTLGRTFL